VGSGWLGDHLSTQKILPVRYRIREDDDGRYLTCVEAPNIMVRLDRAFSVSSTAARKYPEGTVFLDGAAQGEPFIDVERGIYNLDHHEGCVRAFTLSTCEQAMVMILKGLDLRGGDWSLYGNEPDFDTVLAIWLFLNYRRVTGDDSSVRQRLMPLVRLEGVIDAHGLEMVALAGLPEPVQAETLETINHLRALELALKKDGSWQSTDPLDYLLQVLHEIDQLVYTARDFEGLNTIEEVARVPLGNDRVAIVCKTDIGIYEVEKHLRKLHGERVGLIVLEKGPTAITLRQADPFLPRNLEPIYDRLNQVDPNASGDGRWGGSSDIGGSPRDSGTGLTAMDVARVCQWVFRPPTLGQRLGAVASAAAIGMGVVGVGALAATGLVVPDVTHGLIAGGSWPAMRFGGVVSAVSAAILWVQARRLGRQRCAVRRPVDWMWLALAPAALIAALGGGAWVVGGGDAALGGLPLVVSVVILALSCELLFRGVVQGGLAGSFGIMWSGGGWFLSVPLAGSALLSAVVTPLLFGAPRWLLPDVAQPTRLAVVGLSALLLGAACSVARERWASLWPPIVLHVVAAGSALAVALVLS
jgi:hypothetical protein